jgi:hypothetical protein
VHLHDFFLRHTYADVTTASSPAAIGVGVLTRPAPKPAGVLALPTPTPAVGASTITAGPAVTPSKPARSSARRVTETATLAHLTPPDVASEARVCPGHNRWGRRDWNPFASIRERQEQMGAAPGLQAPIVSVSRMLDEGAVMHKSVLYNRLALACPNGRSRSLGTHALFTLRPRGCMPGFGRG